MISEPLSARAPAKINLTLHVTGQRADGYHLLDSLVVRVYVADRLTVAPAEALTLEVAGPRASGVPRDDTNLVLKAARLLDQRRGARITLEKHLPAAAGIGGGSADAAATLSLLSSLWKVPVPEDLAVLGADVPVCMAQGPQRMGGIGAHLTPFAGLPDCALVLVNPGVSAPTAAVFAQLASKNNPPMPASLPTFATVSQLGDWLAAQRNDLEEPARLLVPEIDAVLTALKPHVKLARMSGSGATCFGLCVTEAEAATVAARLAKANPGWWVASGRVLS